MKFLDKKIIFAVLVLLVIAVVLIQHYKVSTLCTFNSTWNFDCSNRLALFRDISLYLSFLTAPVVLTLPFKNYVFESWKKFAKWVVPALLVITVLLVSIDTGGGIGSLIEQMMIFYGIVGLYLLYLLASLIIIFRAWWKGRVK